MRKAQEMPQPAPQEAPQADTADDLVMPDSVVAEVNRALEGVGDHHITPLVGIGIGLLALQDRQQRQAAAVAGTQTAGNLGPNKHRSDQTLATCPKPHAKAGTWPSMHLVRSRCGKSS
jgi:hypothetical protein